MDDNTKYANNFDYFSVTSENEFESENYLDDFNINSSESDFESDSESASKNEKDDSSTMHKENGLQCQLAHWVSINCVNLNVNTKFLKILNEFNPSDVIKLPKDARTFMKTSKIPLVTRGVGHFGECVHFGLEERLCILWLKYDRLLKSVKVCDVFVNFDYVPVNKGNCGCL